MLSPPRKGGRDWGGGDLTGERVLREPRPESQGMLPGYKWPPVRHHIPFPDIVFSFQVVYHSQAENDVLSRRRPISILGKHEIERSQ